MNQKTLLICLSACYLLVGITLYYYLNTQSHYNPDSWPYERIAHNIAAHGDATDPISPGQAPIQTIGYPLFLALIVKFVGSSLFAIVLVQLMLGVGVVWLLYALARRTTGQSSALGAPLFMAGCLGWWVYPQLLLAEMVQLFLIMLFFERLSAWRSGQAASALMVSSCAFGLSLVIKPTLLVLLPVIPLFVWWWARQAAHARIRNGVLWLALAASPLAAHIGYNYYRFERVSIAPMTELNLYQCYLSKLIGHLEQRPAEQVCTHELRFNGAHTFDSAGWYQARGFFKQYVLNYPASAVYIWMLNVAKTALGLYMSQLKSMVSPESTGSSLSFFAQAGPLASRVYAYTGFDQARALGMLGLYEILWSFMRLLLAFIGLYGLWYADRSWALLFGLTIGVSLAVTGFDGCCRYRLVVEPILALAAAVGLVSLKGLRGYLWVSPCKKYPSALN